LALPFGFSLLRLVNTLFDLIYILIMVRVLFSWFRPNPYAPGVNLIYRITEPLLAPFRSILPVGIGLDFSPLLALFFFQVIRNLLVRLLILFF
jgi:YggT family protein